MHLHHVQNVFFQTAFRGEPLDEVGCRFETFRFMMIGVDLSVDEFRCVWLPEVVAERGEHVGERLLRFGAELCRLVQDHHCVGPDVAFRMEGRILPDTDQGFHFGKPEVKLIHASQLPEKNGRSRRGQHRLFQFFHDPLAGKGGKIHPAAEPDRFIRNGKTESCGKLGGAQNAQRVFREGSIADMPDHAFLEVASSPIIIQYFPGQDVLQHGVDREIASSCCLFRPDQRVHKDFEVPVPASGQLFPAGERDIQMRSFQTEHAETHAVDQGRA